VFSLQLRRIIAWMAKVESWLSGLLLGGCCASIGCQLFARFVLGKALPWPEELCVIFLIYLTFLGSGALYKNNEHIDVEYFVDKWVPDDKRMLVFKFVHVCCLIGFIVLAIGTWRGLPRAMNFTTGAAIPIPRGYTRLPLLFMSITNILAAIAFLLFPTEEDIARPEPIEALEID
jgi:TRAP-type C4-dicarboxylate transport system permease small subunit